MIIKKIVWIFFLMVWIKTTSNIQGQGVFPYMFMDTLSIPSLQVKDFRVFSLMDSVCYRWSSSPLSMVGSYAVLTPNVYDDVETWDVLIEQLNDFNTFSLLFPFTPNCFQLEIPYGAIWYKEKLFLVGIAKKKFIGTAYPESRQVVNNYFIKDTTTNIIFLRDSIEKAIEEDSFLYNSDTIQGGDYFNEKFIMSNYFSLQMKYMTKDNCFLMDDDFPKYSVQEDSSFQK